MSEIDMYAYSFICFLGDAVVTLQNQFLVFFNSLLIFNYCAAYNTHHVRFPLEMHRPSLATPVTMLPPFTSPHMITTMPQQGSLLHREYYAKERQRNMQGAFEDHCVLLCKLLSQGNFELAERIVRAYAQAQHTSLIAKKCYIAIKKLYERVNAEHTYGYQQPDGSIIPVSHQYAKKQRESYDSSVAKKEKTAQVHSACVEFKDLQEKVLKKLYQE